jgi:FixJ family two-component response regulator
MMLTEDDEFVRATLAEGLVTAGLQIAAFSDPRMALCSPRSVDPPEVVITDVDLGYTLNGLDVTVAAHDRLAAGPYQSDQWSTDLAYRKAS